LLTKLSTSASTAEGIIPGRYLGDTRKTLAYE
jgi:hypothetical protein